MARQVDVWGHDGELEVLGVPLLLEERRERIRSLFERNSITSTSKGDHSTFKVISARAQIFRLNDEFKNILVCKKVQNVHQTPHETLPYPL